MSADHAPRERLRVFVLFSGGASSGVGLATGPKHKQTYEVVGAGTDKPDASGIAKLSALGVPVVVSDYAAFCREGGSNPKAHDTNMRYHDGWLERLGPFTADTVALSGYFKIVPGEFLGEHPDTKNVHPMALHYLTGKPKNGVLRVGYDQLTDAGEWDPAEAERFMKAEGMERAFRGDSAVFDALLFGWNVRELRSTVHRAMPEYDTGPIEVESAPLPIDRTRVSRMIRTRNFDGIVAYAKELQTELKDRGDVPAFRAAVELTAEGRLVHKDGAVFVDGVRMPYKGFQLG